MALSNFSELKTSILDWMERSDLSANVEDWITLAEARLNRDIEVVETTAALTGTLNSREIDVSSLKVIEPMALFVTTYGDEVDVIPKAPGTFPYDDTPGVPDFYAIDGDTMKFDVPCNAAHTFRFRYRGRFALSDAAPINDLLTNHPDIYLAACIVWGSVYTRAGADVSGFQAILDQNYTSVKNHYAQKKRGEMSVDPALGYWPHHGYDYDTLS